MTGTAWLSKGTVPALAQRWDRLKSVPWLLTVFLISGCGFHLQGRQPLPTAFAYTYVDTKDEQTDFVQNLRKALLASNVNVVPTRGSAGAVITVHGDELAERILSVSARNIPTEYELTYRLEFSVDLGWQDTHRQGRNLRHA